MQKILKNKILIATILMRLTACQATKEKTNTVSEFFKALGTGDTSGIEKVDPYYCTDDGCPDFYKEDEEEWENLEK